VRGSRVLDGSTTAVSEAASRPRERLFRPLPRLSWNVVALPLVDARDDALAFTLLERSVR